MYPHKNTKFQNLVFICLTIYSDRHSDSVLSSLITFIPKFWHSVVLFFFFFKNNINMNIMQDTYKPISFSVDIVYRSCCSQVDIFNQSDWQYASQRILNYNTHILQLEMFEQKNGLRERNMHTMLNSLPLNTLFLSLPRQFSAFRCLILQNLFYSQSLQLTFDESSTIMKK